LPASDFTSLGWTPPLTVARRAWLGHVCLSDAGRSAARRWRHDCQLVTRRVLPGLGGAYKTLAEAATDPQAGYTGLDFVGVEVWFKLLREAVPGIKIGRVRDGMIVWE